MKATTTGEYLELNMKGLGRESFHTLMNELDGVSSIGWALELFLRGPRRYLLPTNNLYRPIHLYSISAFCWKGDKRRDRFHTPNIYVSFIVDGME